MFFYRIPRNVTQEICLNVFIHCRLLCFVCVMRSSIQIKRVVKWFTKLFKSHWLMVLIENMRHVSDISLIEKLSKTGLW